MLRFLISGITLGLAAGLSPGPLLALLVSQTLRYGLREGVKVALAPILTDAPIVTLSLLALSRISDLHSALAWISVFGGIYVAWLGIGSLRIPQVGAGSAEPSPNSIRKAMGINFLNPHPYLFWTTVGGPMVLQAARSQLGWAVAFMAGFYVLLCGSKTVIAVLLHRSRGFLAGRLYRGIVRALGVVLLGFGVWLVWEGLHYFSR